jgi:hypothetical protein
MVYSVGISLSDLAWANIRRDTKRLRYDNRGNGDLNSIGGTNAYLAALLKANPTPSSWTDTRPDYLQEEDAPRLAPSPLAYPCGAYTTPQPTTAAAAC